MWDELWPSAAHPSASKAVNNTTHHSWVMTVFLLFFFTCCSWNAIKIAWISVVCILSFHIVMWINYFTYFGTNHYTCQAVLNTDTNYYEWSVPHQGHTVNTFMNYEYTLYGIRNNVIWNKNKLFQMTSIWQYSHIVNIADSTHIL